VSKIPHHSLRPPTKVVPFTTKLQTFEVSIIIEASLATVVLRNARTTWFLRQGTYFPRSRRWSWAPIPKGITLPPHIQNFAEEQVVLFVESLL
jgi:hypothetical protein